jgi:tetratricopeptide (TPR) repeat protein
LSFHVKFSFRGLKEALLIVFLSAPIEKRVMKRILFFTVLIVLNCSVFGQSNQKLENQLKELYNKEKKAIRKFDRLLDLGKYYQTANIRKADSLKEQLINFSIPLHDSVRLAALIFKAETDLLTGDRNSYFATVLGCQPFLNRVSEERIQLEIYKHLGNYHLLNKELETSNFYLQRMLRTAKSLNLKQNIAEAHLLMSRNFTINNYKDSALTQIEIAIQYARRTSNKSLLAECFHQQASIYNSFGQLELGVAKDILALQIANEIRNYAQVAIFSTEIGKSQFSIHNNQEAEYYFNQALENAKKVEFEREIGSAKVELASIYFSKKNYPSAIQNCLTAVSIFEKLNYQEGLGNAYNRLGLVYKEQKEFVKASSQFNQALIYYESIGDLKQIATVYHNVATIFYAQKKYENALNYLNRSLEISKVYGPSYQMYNTYRVMSDIYKDLGQTKKALEYLQMYINYVESNATEQATGKIAELNELYRAEQRDRLILSQADSIERQRQEKELTSTQLENVQLRSNFQKYVIVVFVLIVILSGVIMYNRWNQNKMKQQQKEAEMSQTLLRTQMNPHFVFNAMSVIQSYIYENDTKNSTKFLVNFSRLMRLILENSSKEEIPIELEEEILQKYLETQKLRFEDRFEFNIFISDELRTEQAMIPPMITQPFIENSIEHGQLHTIPEGGFIHVFFRKNNNMLEVTIEDNGIGRKGAEKNKKSREHKSMAMSITRERINNLNKKYRMEGFLRIKDYDKTLQTGTKVLISLPYRADNQPINLTGK